MLNGGYSLDRYQIADMRQYHKQQLKQGWKAVKEGNIRNRYKEEDFVEEGSTYIRVESFYTEVCVLLKEDGLWWIMKEWDGYSSTTMRGINLVFEKYDIPRMNKKDWEELPYLSWSLI